MGVDVVVFVPGICGSVLQKGEEVIWPGTPMNKVFDSYPDAYVQSLAKDDLAATDVLRSVPLSVLGVKVWWFDGYGRALEFLETLDFRETAGTLVPCPYDWRLDIRTAASHLRARLGASDLAGRSVAIVAHSMGGLVARYMLEHLGAPTGVRVELCALVAVPHLGAPAVLRNILGLRPEIFLTAKQCKAALSSARFPAAYQLLPHPGVPALLQRVLPGGFAEQDVYAPAVAQQLGLVAKSLQAARELAEALVPIAPGFRAPCRYVAIAGNAQKTITANYRDGPAGAWALAGC